MKQFTYFSIVSLFLLLACLAGNAQTTYSFTYDAAGNRTSRIIPLKSAHIANQDAQANQQKTFEDLIGNRPVKIYPNPTKGLLKVEIPFTEEASATIKVFSMQGALVKDLTVNDVFTEIDLSYQPAGMYILRIGIGELTSEWKIIKD
ncbi:MAG: T9SS type A sorting domain-containing protein [Bacteroidota bacterium]|nr:T9SS type A sorting domain-containing protein [Bacteroidota bacterium]